MRRTIDENCFNRKQPKSPAQKITVSRLALQPETVIRRPKRKHKTWRKYRS